MLSSLCSVLGIDYKAKIREFGIAIDKRRVDEAINFLTTTRDCNFEELKKLSEELISEWELSRAPFKKMASFAWVLYIKDAADASQLRGKNLLSTNSVNEVQKELVVLKKERNEMAYTAKMGKLDALLKGTHLTYKDINFSPKEQVEQEDFQSEIRDLKDHIKDVKSLASQRTQLVLRVELVTKAKTIEDIEVYIYNAKSAASVLRIDDEEVPYDGRDVDDVLNIYREKFIAAAAEKDRKKAAAAKKGKKTSTTGLATVRRRKGTASTASLVTGTTRNGTTYHMSETTVDVDDDEDELEGTA